MSGYDDGCAALSRLDDGLGRPDDMPLAEHLDRLCQAGEVQLLAEEIVRDHERQLAHACPLCVDGGAGEWCDRHEREVGL